MARFYFTTDNAEHIDDREGSLLPDLSAAVRQGQLLIGELLNQETLRFWPSGGLRVTISDASDLTLAVVEISGTTVLAPAASVSPRTGFDYGERSDAQCGPTGSLRKS